MKFLTTLLLTILTFSLTSAQTVFNYSDSLHSYKISIDSIFLGDKLNYDCYIKTISVYSKSSKKLLQIITPPYIACSPLDQIFDFDDINFDGLTDFMIAQGFGTPNTPYYYWTFNNKINQFQRDTTLEVITSPKFDKKQKLVTSFWRASCCDHGLSTYKYIDGKITLIEETEITYDLDNSGQQITTKKVLVDGEMKLVERTVEKVEKEK